MEHEGYGSVTWQTPAQLQPLKRSLCVNLMGVYFFFVSKCYDQHFLLRMVCVLFKYCNLSCLCVEHSVCPRGSQLLSEDLVSCKSL